jgi:pimeloyl-ACP methyl ester carboxylesterase
MTHFQKSDQVVDGVRVQVLETGKGKPLVYFHGAGASGGFDELLPLAEQHRLIVPIHPGFGGSDDDPTISSVIDYVVHYAALFDALKLHEPVDLVPEHPGADLFMISPEKLPSTLAASPTVLAKMTQGEVTVDMKVARYREMISLARVIWERSYDPKLDRWLKRVSVPTLILWGEQDKVLPVEQARRWADRLASGAKISTFDGVGHLVFLESHRAVKRVASFLNGAGS